MEDTITLELARGRRDYRVIGFFHSMWWDGGYALIGERFLKHDGLQQWYDALYVQADRDADAVKEDIGQKFSRRDPWIRTVVEMVEYARQWNGELLRGLQGFAFMALAIAVIAGMAVNRSGETIVPVQVSIDDAPGFLLPNFNVDVAIGYVEQDAGPPSPASR